MKTFKNNQKANKTMVKRLILIFSILFLSLISVNALSLEVTQDANLYDYENEEKGNYLFFDVVGSYSTTHNDSYFEINSTNYTFDKKIEFSALSQPFYVIINNQIPNSSFMVMWQGDLSLDGTRYIQPLQLNEQGKYYLKFVPQTEGEPASIWFEYEDTGIGQLSIVENKPMGFNQAMAGFVNSFVEIIGYNIALWSLSYYVIIFLLIVTFIGALFTFGFTLFLYAKKIKNGNLKRVKDEE